MIKSSKLLSHSCQFFIGVTCINNKDNMRKRCIIRAVTSPLIITAIAVAYILILLNCVYCHCSQPAFLSELFDHPIQTFNIYLGNGSLSSNYHTSDKTPLSALAYIQKGIIQHTSGSQIPEHNTTISPG